MNAEELAESVAASFGERPRRHGREWRVRCPVHEAVGEHSPSLAIWQNGSTVRYRCMTGCPKISVAAALKQRGVSVGNTGAVSIEAQLLARKQQLQRKVDALTKARDIVVTAKDIIPDTASYRYLDARHLRPELDENYSLRDCEDPLHHGGRAFCAVVADLRFMRSDAVKATGVQTLSLLPDGTPRIAEGSKHKLRSVLGQLTGSAVPLGDWSCSDHLVVAEGVETAMAAKRIYGAACAAAVLSASNYAALLVPEWITKVTIAADNDMPGITGANKLYDQLRGTGVAVIIRKWGEPGSGWDAADELLRERMVRSDD